MTITELNFMFIGRCLGQFLENVPELGKLLHSNAEVDWHTKVYNCDLDNYIIEEAFLDHGDCKWQKAFYLVKKNSFSWNIEKEGNKTHLITTEYGKDIKELINS